MAAIRLPSRFARREMLIGVGDAPVVLLAELVIRRIRIGIAPQPELLDEGIPLLVVAQALEGLGLFVGDDPGYILIEPGLVGARNFVLQFLLPVELLLIRERPLQRVN